MILTFDDPLSLMAISLPSHRVMPFSTYAVSLVLGFALLPLIGRPMPGGRGRSYPRFVIGEDVGGTVSIRVVMGALLLASIPIGGRCTQSGRRAFDVCHSRKITAQTAAAAIQAIHIQPGVPGMKKAATEVAA